MVDFQHSPKGDYIGDSLFTFQCIKTILKKESTMEGKNVLLRSKFLPVREALDDRVGKTFLTALPPQQVYPFSLIIQVSLQFSNFGKVKSMSKYVI